MLLQRRRWCYRRSYGTIALSAGVVRRKRVRVSFSLFETCLAGMLWRLVTTCGSVTSRSTLSPDSTWLVTSRLDTTRQVRRVEPMHFGSVSSLSNSTARHVRRVERVASCRDVTSQVEFGL